MLATSLSFNRYRPPETGGYCRALFAAVVLLALSTDPAWAQPSETRATAWSLTGQQSTGKPLWLGGCYAAAQRTSTPTILVVTRRNLLYRATVKGLQIATPRHLQIVGGLRPTTNLAAQPTLPAGPFAPVIVAEAAMMPSQIGVMPFAPPRQRLVWVPSVADQCATP